MSCNYCTLIEKIDAPFKVCSRCKKTKYCSKYCQTEDWIQIHRFICKEDKEDKEDAKHTINENGKFFLWLWLWIGKMELLLFLFIIIILMILFQY